MTKTNLSGLKAIDRDRANRILNILSDAYEKAEFIAGRIQDDDFKADVQSILDQFEESVAEMEIMHIEMYEGVEGV